MNSNEFSIEDVIEELKCRRPVFTSEADFQLELAHSIKEVYPTNAKVRLEYVPDIKTEQRLHIDILVLWSTGNGEKKLIPIELKYKTRRLDGYTDDDGCVYCLKEQSAHDCGCYDYLKDIFRIEQIKSAKANDYLTGFTIFLTNDENYKNNSNRKANYDNFRICDGRTASKELSWGTPQKKTDERYCNINLNGKYSFNWKVYSEVNNQKFFILVNRI